MTATIFDRASLLVGGQPLVTATLAGLSTISDSSFSRGKQAFVTSRDAMFLWSPGFGLTAADGMIVNGVTGQWTRQSTPSVKYQAQATWSIDESNTTGLASDDNSGIDDAHPLLNIDEYFRRIGGLLKQSTQVRWLSNTTHTSVNLETLLVDQSKSATIPVLTFFGVPTVIRSGTLTGAADGSSTPWTVSDSALATSWNAAGCLSTTGGSRLIRKADKTKHAFLYDETVAKTAKTSPTTGYSATNPDIVFSGSSASFANGEAYEFVSLPTFPDITLPSTGSNFNGTVLVYLDFIGGIRGGYVQARLCGFRNYAACWNAFAGGGLALFGCIIQSGGYITGQNASNAMDRTLTLGAWQFNNWGGDQNGMVNVVAKGGQWWFAHGSIGQSGTVVVYDCTSNPAVRVSNRSNTILDAMPNGGGNTGVLVEVRDPGCSVVTGVAAASLTASFAATTSSAHPVKVISTDYDWSALPAWQTNQNAGFGSKP